MGITGFLRSARSAVLDEKAKRYWLFYAGPENYLFDGGIRELPKEAFWSCEPETRQGDHILVYRKSLNQLSVERLVKEFGMSKDVAVATKRSGAGKDFPAIWEAVSNAKRKLFWAWPYGCDIREVRRIEPPVLLDELKAEPRLKGWEGLRWNLQAQGQSALEIPEFAWNAVLEIVDNPRSQRPTTSIRNAEP